MIRVIEQTTAEREQEIINLFNKIKPLLDEGHSYWSALREINPKLLRNSINKRVKEYGETQGYSPKDYNVCAPWLKKEYIHPDKNKWGLLNVCLCSAKSCVTSHRWEYHYFKKGVLKKITRNDLKELRKVIEDNGLKWKVIDLEKAKKAYEFNEFIQNNKRENKTRNKSGVFRVSKRKCAKCNHGHSWKYEDKRNSIYLSSVNPQNLKQKVLDKGLEWIVLDEEKAKANGLI